MILRVSRACNVIACLRSWRAARPAVKCCGSFPSLSRFAAAKQPPVRIVSAITAVFQGLFLALIASGHLDYEAQNHMKRVALAAPILLFLCATFADAQPVSRLKTSTVDQVITNDSRRAIAQLKRLEQQVIVYRSLGDLEDGRRLALVPLATFEKDLREVTSELEVILPRMPEGRVKTQLVNALASYRDGVFWWRQIDQPRVVDISALRYSENTLQPVDKVLISSIPYTVTTNWRQASRYLARAERIAD